MSHIANPGLARTLRVFSGAEKHLGGNARAGARFRYLVMEFVGGPSLLEWIQDNRAASLRARLDLLATVAAALDGLHAATPTSPPVAHGDISPTTCGSPPTAASSSSTSASCAWSARTGPASRWPRTGDVVRPEHLLHRRDGRHADRRHRHRRGDAHGLDLRRDGHFARRVGRRFAHRLPRRHRDGDTDRHLDGFGERDPREFVPRPTGRWTLTPGSTFGFGRAPREVDIAVPLEEEHGLFDPKVPRTAGRLEFVGGQWYLTNHASTPTTIRSPARASSRNCPTRAHRSRSAAGA